MRAYPALVSVWSSVGRFHRWRQSVSVRFAVRFLLGLGAALVLYSAASAWMLPLQVGIASTVAQVASWLGLGTTSAGTIVFDASLRGYDITPACTGVVIGLLYAAAVVAYPATWRSRLLGLAVGLPLLGVCNLVRIVSIVWVGVRIPALFDAMHVYYWQLLLVLIVGFGFGAWTLWVARPPEAKAPGMRSLRRPALAFAVFVGLFSLLWFLGGALGLVPAYGRLVFALVRVAENALWRQPSTIHDEGSFGVLFVWDYVAIGTVVSLFAASIHRPLRKRVLGLFLWALPLTIVGQVAAWVVLLRTHNSLSVFTGVLLESFRMLVLPLLAWLVWILPGQAAPPPAPDRGKAPKSRARGHRKA